MNYVLYWRSGTHELVEGETIEDAFTNAGYGAGAVRALDFYMIHYPGQPLGYEWNPGTKEWDKLPEPTEAEDNG